MHARTQRSAEELRTTCLPAEIADAPHLCCSAWPLVRRRSPRAALLGNRLTVPPRREHMEPATPLLLPHSRPPRSRICFDEREERERKRKRDNYGVVE